MIFFMGGSISKEPERARQDISLAKTPDLMQFGL